jgi:hypothetical protein
MTSPSFSPTPEQAAIVEAIQSPDSCMVNAYAGAAKTTTLQLASQKVRVPALALAFNKKIARELEGRVPGNFTVKTLNGLGHGAWARTLPPGTTITLDDRKLGKLVTQVAKERKVDLASQQWDDLRRLVSGAMQAGIVPADEGRGLRPDNHDAWESIADDLWINLDDFEFLYDMAHEILVRSIAMARQGIISFDDQVYCSTCLGGRFAGFPVVLVVEAQDLCTLNHAMLALSIRDGGKLVAVGDPKQAIYSFRGADSASMAKIRGLRDSWIDLPLATTFRCPKRIVARQLAHAPGFKAWHTNCEGEVRGLAQTPEASWDWGDIAGLQPSPSSRIAILCRNNGPLLSMAFRLIRQGIGVTMLGRDLGKGLASLSKKLAPDDSTSAVIVSALITEWLERETSLALANDHPERVASFEDRAECLRAVIASAGVRDAGGLRQALARLFAREDGLVVLGSIHRAKGLEWDLVVHLDPWRIPSKWAKKAAMKGDDSQLQQEYNLRYVVETRTKHTLVNASLENFNSN